MRRWYLPEIEDQPWCPSTVRTSVTDLLSFLAKYSRRAFLPFAAQLRLAMDRTGDRQILDLCSGGGGPIRQILDCLNGGDELFTARVSDLYPDLDRLERVKAGAHGRIEVIPEPVDATKVPPEMEGFRLVVNGFHHFGPDGARAVIADAVAARRGIAILEGLDRSPMSLFNTLLSPLAFLLLLPFIRPIHPLRWLLAYVIPVLPFIVLWDGLASCARFYSLQEMDEMVASVGATDYHWQSGRLFIPGAPMHTTYYLGRPMTAQELAAQSAG